ncbi:hypothetical protein AAIB48_00410 (plasmid) [Paraclostridium benzoelyticum]|uniref:hypothetical protein n=1 Tax=Paraclostridium benzoelyticum TaxID=1629550 RepID=UPI0031CD680D
MSQFRKMDEMEKEISLKSIKASWFYTVIFLFIWSIYQYLNSSEWGIPFFLFITQNLVLLATQFIFKKRYK